MGKLKDTQNKLKSRIEAIKKINDDPQAAVDAVYDKYLKDLPTTDQLFGKKLDDFLTNRRKKLDNKKDIFGQIMEIADSILSSNTRTDRNRKPIPTKLFSKNRLKYHAQTAANKTLDQSKDIVLECVKRHFFAAGGICGADQTINIDTLKIKPNEFDFLNVLTVDPSQGVGKIVYEPTTGSTPSKIKVNTELYESFGGSVFSMRNNSDNLLFDMKWDTPNQEWTVSGLTSSNLLTVEELLNDYYSSIELPDIQHVVKTAMLITLQGTGENTPLLDKGMNQLNRLLSKLFAICGTPTDRNSLSKQTAVDLFDENDQDIELYFNFDDVEGIDLDDEDARLRKVLKFRDCNNFEVPINTTMMEDFVYLGYRKNLNDLVDSTLNRAATDAYSQSDSSIPQAQFNLNLVNLFILNLPKALIMSALSPKIFLPIILIYKIFKVGVNQVADVLTSMRNLSQLFWNIIRELFWLFIREFWKLIKVDLLAFVMVIVKKILKNKYKRYVVIITALIAILTKILEEGIDNCFAIFNTILSTLQNALSINAPINIPGILLGLSDKLPGYSQDKAYLNIIERLENAGISLGPIFGVDNNLPQIVKSIIDGNTEELDTSSFVKVTNKEMIIPTPFGPLFIPPGLLNSTGKIF
jgi:hypothetical protein